MRNQGRCPRARLDVLTQSFFAFQSGFQEPEIVVSVHQTGDRESSERNHVLQRSPVSSAVLGGMVTPPSLSFEASISQRQLCSRCSSV